MHDFPFITEQFYLHDNVGAGFYYITPTIAMQNKFYQEYDTVLECETVVITVFHSASEFLVRTSNL